jgi:hypothetical protein
MGYHHKRASCARQTKEILDDILRLGKAKDEIIEAMPSIRVSSPIDEILRQESDANILPSRAQEIIQSEAAERIEVPKTSYEDGQGTEQYESSLEIKFAVKESDDLYTKKRKKRNLLTTDSSEQRED